MVFYYPGPMWSSGDQVKNLILFFDGIALLVPNYIREKPFLQDPALATGLAEHGLLEILEPEDLIDADCGTLDGTDTRGDYPNGP
jgi:hypothetical protein